MIGKTISHYRILEKLGEGGMGVVYKAEDTRLKRSVALKFLPPELTRDPKAKQRFMFEAQAASALDHSNIGTIYEIDETPGEPGEGQMFIAMAYYEGETLQNKIESGTTGLSLQEAVDIAIQIALGLARAHAKEIVHRDIKPANILITEDGEVKIIDFGLAKLTGRSPLTRTGVTMGTVAYMSPEQAEGRSVDHRTDVWSLGVVLYEMLTRQQPFRGETDISVLHSIVHEDPEIMTTLRSDVPGEIERLVEKALSKNPDKRFKTMKKMLSELQTLSEELKPGQLKKRRVMTLLTRKQRTYLYRTLAGLVVLIFAGVLYIWQHVQRQEMETRSPSRKESRSETISVSKNRIAILPLANISFDYFNRAIELDPNYALAYAGLADSYTWFGTYHVIPAKEAFPRAKEAALRALKIDDQLGEAHTSLAIILRNYDWNWMEAEREFRRAIELNPNYATAHIHYAVHLTAMGRFGEAIAEANRALELDPFSSTIGGNLGIILYWARQYDQAIEQLRQTIAMRPDMLPVPLILNLNLAYVQKGMVQEAISELEKARTRSPNNPDLVALLGYAYGKAGNRREAQKVLDEFKEMVHEEHVLFNLSFPMNLALIHIGLGEKDQAFEWLERAYAERAWLMMTLKTEPYFDPLRSDPRFTVLLQKMGLE